MLVIQTGRVPAVSCCHTAVAEGRSRSKPPLTLEVRSVALELGNPVIPSAQGPLEPYIEDDEEIAATHLFHRQLGNPRGAVGPVGWHDRVGVAADDRLERHLDSKV